MEISYEALRKIQLQERNFGALSALEEDFYEKYNLWILEQKRLLSQGFNIETLKAYENAKKIIEEISNKREQKIVLKALKDMRNNSIDTVGLSSEEKTYYLKILTSSREFEESVVQFSEKKPEMVAERKEMEKLSQKLLSIKMLAGMGKFVAPDGVTYGPFSVAQIVSIDEKIGEFLVKKGIAERDGEEKMPQESEELSLEERKSTDGAMMN